MEVKGRRSLSAYCQQPLQSFTFCLPPLVYLAAKPRLQIQLILLAKSIVFADDGNTTNVHGRETAQIVGQTVFWVFNLAFAGPAVAAILLLQ